jgi:DNA-binding transcriptional MerR regulator
MTPKLYKAADVCEMAQLQPYVLRSWEKEFPGIGVQKSADSPRLYRQSDVDQVMRIKQLVFGEGLTLSGARKRLEAQLTTTAPAVAEADDADDVLETLGQDARAKIATVRAGLRSLLDTLSHSPGSPPPLRSVSRRPAAHERRSEPAADEEYELRPPSAKPRAAKPAPLKPAPLKPAPLKPRAIASRSKTARVASKPTGRSKTKTSSKRKRANA